jgi:hypothetical protein
MSEHLARALARGEFVNIANACDEDMYCLGYLVLEMMTGTPGTQAQKNVGLALEVAGKCYSKKLVGLVKSMVEEVPERRFTLDKLRFKIKMEEEEIMRQEMADYKRNKTGQKQRRLERLDSQAEQLADTTQPNINAVLVTNRKETKSDSFLPSSKYKNNVSPYHPERKSLMFFSPHTHRILETKSPSGVNFRYGSPRNF